MPQTAIAVRCTKRAAQSAAAQPRGTIRAPTRHAVRGPEARSGEAPSLARHEARRSREGPLRRTKRAATLPTPRKARARTKRPVTFLATRLSATRYAVARYAVTQPEAPRLSPRPRAVYATRSQQGPHGACRAKIGPRERGPRTRYAAKACANPKRLVTPLARYAPDRARSSRVYSGTSPPAKRGFVVTWTPSAPLRAA